MYIFKVFFCQSASIVAAGRDREVHIRDASSGTLIRTLPVEYEAIIGIAYRLDGKVFAAAGTSGKAQLFDRTTRKALLSWDACLGGLSNIVFSPDGSQLAVMSNETNDAKVFDAAFGGELLVLKGHTKTTEVLTITWMELAFSRPGAMRLHGSEMRRPVSL